MNVIIQSFLLFQQHSGHVARGCPGYGPPTLAALLAVLFMFRLYAPMPPAWTTQFATVGTQKYPTSPMSMNTR